MYDYINNRCYMSPSYHCGMTWFKRMGQEHSFLPGVTEQPCWDDSFGVNQILWKIVQQSSLQRPCQHHAALHMIFENKGAGHTSTKYSDFSS